MKKFFISLLAVAAVALSANATDLTGKRIYVNPGHGSFGPNDRPMPTIPYPNLPTTGMPDTCGFYESNTDLWKCLYLRDKLEARGAYVMMSRTQNGPWPYVMVNGDYPTYTYSDYQSQPDYVAYNRNLSEICEEVEANNMDLFISVHSNAATDGSTTNYPLFLYRGNDNGTTQHEQQSKAIGEATWPYRFEMFGAGFDFASYYTATNMNVRGDITFYGSSSTRHSAVSGNDYTGYLGVLKHGAKGGLWEGFFHTYQPARHRALNHDYCHVEGYAYYRGIVDYFGATPDATGIICGSVRDIDQRIVNALYKYAPKTNDQWLPCNGATVQLKNATGDVLQTYQVDSLYNGLFCFYDLAPGTYYLDASCPGYYGLDDEQKAKPIVVTANKVTYPFIQLRDTSWRPDPVVYENYPTPVQPASLGLAGTYHFDGGTSVVVPNVFAGKVIRSTVIASQDSMYVLALDTAAHASYLYLVNPTTGACSAVSTQGTQGEIYPLYSIAMTADHVLVGCNFTQNQFSDDYLYPGETETFSTGVRGTWRTYYWNMSDLSAAPTPWFTTQYSANWYSAYIGGSMAVSGTLNDCVVATGLPSIWYSRTFRMACFEIENGNIVAYYRNETASMKELEHTGEDWTLKVSPRDDARWIMDGSLTNPFEYAMVGEAGTIVKQGTMAEHYQHADYFRYAGKQVMVAPEMENGQLNAFALYDITDGLNAATAIKTVLAPKEEGPASWPATYTAAKAFVKGADITVFVVSDSTITRYTTANIQQPVVAHVCAYGLNATQEGDQVTLTFTTNEQVNAATLVLYATDGTEVGTLPLTNIVKGQNTVELSSNDLPGAIGDTLRWAVRLEGDAVGNWGRVFQESGRFTRPFISVNTQPESDYFGYLYLMERKGGSNAGNGFFAYTPAYQHVNETVLKGGRTMFGSPYRTYVDDQGYIWISDGSDGYSGIFVADPANLNGTYEEFWAGASRNGAGLLTNNGVAVGSSSLGLSVYGTGANTKLLTFNEDAGTGLPELSLAIYNIGTDSGTYLHHWTTAPSQVIPLQGTAAIDGYPLGCEHGFWFTTRRSSGNNNASATALQFYDWNGTRQMTSAVDPYLEIIDGSYSGACAMNKEENVLYFIDGSKHLMVFDIAWEGDKPNMTLRYSFDCGLSSIREMHLDYAGNLVTSGEDGIVVFTVPTDENVTTIPAKKALTLVKGGTPTDVEKVASQNVEVKKIFRDGRIVIIRNGISYTVTGQLIR